MALAPEEIGKRITEARKSKGYATHEQFLAAVREHIEPRTNLRTVQRWQKGRDPKTGKSWLPRLETLMDLADMLEVPRSYFVEGPAAEEDHLTLSRVADDAAATREMVERILGLLEQLDAGPSRAASG